MRISQLLQRSAQIYSKSPFLGIDENGNQTILTYHDSRRISLSYEEWIQDMLMKEVNKLSTENEGVQVVIAFLSHNSPDLLLAMMGGMHISNFQAWNKKVHVTSAMINVRWSANEISKALAVKSGKEGTRHLTLILHSRELEGIAKETCSVINMDQLQQGQNHYALSYSLPTIHKMVHDISMTGMKVQRDEGEKFEDSTKINEDAVLLFTSGTTSGPKGVRLSHLSLLIQAMAKTTSPCSYDSSTKMLATTVPFFHVGGVSSALAIIMCGGMLIFPSTNSVQGFNPSLVLNSMDRRNEIHTEFGINTLVIVPAMLHAIFCEIEKNHSSSNPTIYDGVRLLLVGGQSITSPQVQKSKICFPNARIVQTYACTEAGSSMTFATIFDPQTSKSDELIHRDDIPRGTCAGFPPHHVDLMIFKLDEHNKPTKQFAQPYIVGAIGTRGPHVMNGYWKRGQLNSTDNQKNHWLVMNDLGYVDAFGQLFFCGRSNDVIRTGGESVFAPEVESVIIQHPEIDHCAVFALPDEKFGECVCAAIMLKNQGDAQSSSSINESSDFTHAIRSFCEERHLTGYKRPRFVFLCKELPYNSSGKVLKHILANKCAQVRNKRIHSNL